MQFFFKLTVSVFFIGTETPNYPKIFSFLTQADDEHIKCLEYITDRALLLINNGILSLELNNQVQNNFKIRFYIAVKQRIRSQNLS